MSATLAAEMRIAPHARSLRDSQPGGLGCALQESCFETWNKRYQSRV